MPANRPPGQGSGGGGRYFQQNVKKDEKHNNSYQAKNDAKDIPVVKKEASQITPKKNEAVKYTKSPSNNAEQLNVQDKRSHEKQFTQRSRLFVGNLPIGMPELDFKKLFSSYGVISETFINIEKGYGFIRMDTRVNAEKAKYELDGATIKNRTLRVRFAMNGAALSIKNLSPYVSNELLEEAFTQFGPVERAVVVVDDRGRSTEKGIIEFTRKSSAMKAMQQIREGCFLLTASPRAITASQLEQEDTEDGLQERNIQKTPQYFQEREAPPRFAQPGTFEEEFARRWKALDDLEKEQRDQLEKNIQNAREKLESEMENAIHEHKTMLMKQDLMRRQEELQRLEEARKREIDRRQQLEAAREDARKKELEEMQHRQEMLRAQIDGSYKSDDIGGFPRGSQGFGRTDSPKSNNAFLHEALAQEMMAGGPGNLNPPPSRFEQNRPMMVPRGDMGPPMGAPPRMGDIERGYGGGQGYNRPQHPAGRRSYSGVEYDEQQKRRRY